MAAPKKSHDEMKDKQKPWKYAQEIEPDKEVITMYCEQLLDCRDYKSDYKECTSIKGRLNQYFIYGQTLDCQHLKDAFQSCERYVKTKDEEAKDYLVSYELAKRDFRMTNARENTVWEYRMTPYREWNAPLQKVKPEEINKEDDFLAAQQNTNFNNSNSNNEKSEKVSENDTKINKKSENNSKVSEKSEKKSNVSDTSKAVSDQSNQKGGSTQTDISKKVNEAGTDGPSNNKGMCVVS